jgi:hypothetical protein
MSLWKEEKMTKPKVFIALTTTHGQMQTMFVPTLMNLFQQRTFDMVLWMYTDPYIVLARNAAAADFLKGDATHIMFIDVDILDPQVAHHIERMLSHDEALVGGLYPKKDETKLNWVCNALPDKPPEDERGLIPLRHIGTGFMLIKREVFTKMLEVFGDEIAYLEDETDRPLWDFFDMPRVDGRKISEDWHFCNTARGLGFKVWGDTHVRLMHVGTAIFPLRHQAERVKINVTQEPVACAR